MKNLIFYSQLLLVFVILSCNTKNTEITIHKSKNDKRKWLKDYALCSCIKHSFKEDTLIKNDLSFTLYVEISDYGNLNIYKTIDSLSEHAALDITPSQIADHNGKKALLNGCINFYESKKLDSMINTYDNFIQE